MKAWSIAHAQACQRAIRRLWFEPTATALSILVIGIAITLPLGLYAVFTNITNAASRINTDPNINVYLAVNASDTDARDVEKRLRSLQNVKQVRFVPREQALAEMKRAANLADLLAGLDANPLPHAFTLQPSATDADALATLRKSIAALPKVEHVVMDFEWAQKLKQFATFAERLVILLGMMLAIAVAFVTGNTIRLQILTQKDEIEVSQLIGATQRFIRRPFLYFGALQGLMAGGVAVLAVSACLAWAGTEVKALTSSYGAEFSLTALSVAQGAVVVAGSALLGWTGAFLSVWIYLVRNR